MAKHTVKIQPVSLNGDKGIICSYYDIEAKKTFAILQDDTVVVNPGKDALLKKINFSSSYTTHVIEFDDAVSEDKRFKEQAQWWRRQPETLDMNAKKKHSNLVRLGYTYIDVGNQKDMQAKLIENVSQVLDKLMKAGPEGRVKIATFYGVTGASQKKDGELIIELGDMRSGKLMNPKLMWDDEKDISFMDHFLNEYKSDSAETIFKVNVKKAVAMGLIEQKKNTPGKPLLTTFYINNDPIASSEDALIIYLKEHPDLYETYIVDRINADNKQKKDLADAQLKSNKGALSEVEIRKRGKELGIKGYAVIKIVTLQGLIEEAEKQLAPVAPEDQSEEKVLQT